MRIAKSRSTRTDPKPRTRAKVLCRIECPLVVLGGPKGQERFESEFERSKVLDN